MQGGGSHSGRILYISLAVADLGCLDIMWFSDDEDVNSLNSFSSLASVASTTGA